MTITLEVAVADAQRDGRVCPMPQQWKQLHDMLPDKRRKGAGWEPSLPLILDGWWYSSDAEKRSRLREHLEWADKQGCLAEVYEFISQLPDEQWHHIGD